MNAPFRDTLQEAIAMVEANRDEGLECPCCGQLARSYWRRINSAMARDLIWLVRQSGDDLSWVDLHEEAPIQVQQSRELARLAHWGLIEEKLQDSERGARTSGIWRPTYQGIRFARGQIAVAAYVKLYDNRVLEFSSDRTTVWESLGKHFDFDELWRGY